jgi:hypothetical protein
MGPLCGTTGEDIAATWDLRWYCPCGGVVGADAVVLCGWCDGIVEWRVEEFPVEKMRHVYRKSLESLGE